MGVIILSNVHIYGGSIEHVVFTGSEDQAKDLVRTLLS